MKSSLREECECLLLLLHGVENVQPYPRSVWCIEPMAEPGSHSSQWSSGSAPKNKTFITQSKSCFKWGRWGEGVVKYTIMNRTKSGLLYMTLHCFYQDDFIVYILSNTNFNNATFQATTTKVKYALAETQVNVCRWELLTFQKQAGMKKWLRTFSILKQKVGN